MLAIELIVLDNRVLGIEVVLYSEHEPTLPILSPLLVRATLCRRGQFVVDHCRSLEHTCCCSLLLGCTFASQFGELHVFQSVILLFIEAFQVEPLELTQDVLYGC